MRLGWGLVTAWLAACGTPDCPPGSTYSPLFGQCVGVEAGETPPAAHSAAPTADTGVGG